MDTTKNLDSQLKLEVKSWFGDRKEYLVMAWSLPKNDGIPKSEESSLNKSTREFRQPKLILMKQYKLARGADG